MSDARMQNCAAALHVLSGVTRFEVIRLLLERSRHVLEMVDELGIEQSLLSHHLRVLRETGLVEASRDGRRMAYRNSAAFESEGRSAALEYAAGSLSFDS